MRSIQEPENERSIVGERAGFVEQLSVNLNLV
ncbi:spore germination protein [Paenibacillus sp. MWE-103]|uniref:Spore germination protein n=1 Tax=Paenibacillus artemisiicola TaxID=1172618 RepID=A0ABS3WEL1_9BACL|nr:spore germination protein [Paenibacillus artemisiicola]